MATIWQRGHLNVIDPTAFPVEFLKPCAEAGYAVTQVMLNPKHPDTSLDQVPLSYLRDIRLLGMKAWGFVWADDFASPDACYDFCRDWRKKSLDAACALTGFVINAEDAVEAKDEAGEAWSYKFVRRFRSDPLTAKLSLALNTYIGCGRISLAIWLNWGARLYCQTFHEANTHEWPINGYIPWAKSYGFTQPAKIKPNWSTYSPYPNRAAQVQSAQWADTIGFSAWYAEGSGEPKDLLIPLLREAKLAGVSY